MREHYTSSRIVFGISFSQIAHRDSYLSNLQVLIQVSSLSLVPFLITKSVHFKGCRIAKAPQLKNHLLDFSYCSLAQDMSCDNNPSDQ